MQFYRNITAQADQVAAGGGSAGAGPPARYQHLQSLSYEDVLRDKVIVGTPEVVVDRLRALREELGLAGILAELNCGGQIPHARVRRSLQLLCQEVLPHFR